MELTKENIKLVAAKVYRVPKLSDKEFSKDFSLVNKISKRLTEFASTGDIKIAQTINFLTTAVNCFGIEFVVKSLFLRSPQVSYPTIISFISELGFPEKVVTVNKNIVIVFSEYADDVGIRNRIKEWDR